jgi:hypothetical protein
MISRKNIILDKKFTKKIWLSAGVWHVNQS